MRSLTQMCEFVHNNILETFAGLLGEFCVETNGPRSGIAAAPLGLHVSDVETGDVDFEAAFPGVDQRLGGAESAIACAA